MFTESMKFTNREYYACFILTTRFPLHTYKCVSNSSSSGFLNPVATPPSNGIIHGLKYDKNLSDSCPWISLCCTARPPRDASSSTVLMAAVPDSSYKKNHNVNKDYSFVKIYWFKNFQTTVNHATQTPSKEKCSIISKNYFKKREREKSETGKKHKHKLQTIVFFLKHNLTRFNILITSSFYEEKKLIKAE